MLLTNTQNNTDIALIVSRSRYLAERLSSPVTTTDSADSKNEAKITERLEQWCHIVAQGNFAKFERRLAWAGLDMKTIRPLLVDSDRNLPQPLPPWATTLTQVIKKAQTLSHEQRLVPQRYLDLKEPVPFEQIYLPCLQVARSRLAERVSGVKILANSVQAALERQLLSQLSDVCTATLMAEFSAFRSSGNTTRDFILFNIINCNHQEKYYAFIQQLFADGLLSLFQKYPVLGRLVASTINLWVDATGEFIERLATDWWEIRQSFSARQPLKQVVEIKSGLSDPHNGGRTVIILTFDTGMKLVYKPKDLRIEAAFSQLLDWVNRQEQLLSFKVIQVLNYDTHGWVEYVESLPCKQEAEVQCFYQRSGMLLCLIHLIEGTDCHYDNLIANGEHPVLIDTETLFHHHNKISESLDLVESQVLAQKKLTESPLRTLMLPQWGLSAQDDLNIDLSGLGGREEQVGSALKWKNINTDSMKSEPDFAILKKSNALTLNKIAISPDSYLTELIAGFEQMYRFLSDRQEFLSSWDSPLMIFTDLKVRYVFRATRTYDSIVRGSLSPELLQSGIDRSINLDILSRAFVLSEQKPDFWSILEAELRAIEQLDIPFFSIKTSQASLDLSTGVVIPKLFAQSSFERVISRLKSLSKADLDRQLEIIRGSFCARFLQEPNCTISENRDNIAWLPKCSPFTSEKLVQETLTLAQDLRQRGIYAGNSVTWIGLGLRPNCQGFQLQSLSNNLADGSPGVALFLAALAKVTGNSDWRDLALRTLQPLRYQLQDLNPEVVKGLTRLGIGGTTGLGSIVYALVQISHFISDADFIEDAKKIARLITPELISADRTFTLKSGAAGAILACLKLSEVDRSALDQAIACGEHLLKNQIRIGEQLKTGFSQGAAGIAYALLRLFEITQDSRFLKGAKKAIAYEQGYFSTSAQNWRDLSSEQLIFHNSWANGAAGIGLGRLGGLSILDTAAISQEITYAVTTTQKYCLEDLDNLAWGNLGRIETLLVASQILNRPDLLDFGLQATTHLIQQAKLRGRFNLGSRSVPATYNPGFFQGTTGIGYQLLRMAYPHLLPSILLWE